MSQYLAALATLALTGFPAHAARDKALYEAAQRQTGDALALLERLVNVDSGSGDGPGLARVHALVIPELQKLGAAIETFPATPNAGDNVVATLRGKGKGRILLIAHTDTVFGPGTVAKRPFKIERGRAYGPGVADNKCGVIAALYALKLLDGAGFRNFGQITLLLNPNEELGSDGSRALIERLAREHDVALNLEPGREADGLVAWRKGSAEAVVEIKGKSAHAGSAAERGINAATELAHQVLQLSTLGDAAQGTSIHFTVLAAGERSNVIPDSAWARADVRALSTEEFDRIERDLIATAKQQKVPNAEVKVRLERSFPPFQKNPATDALVQTAQAIYAEIGRTLTVEGSGGAADSSLTAGVGTPSLDALGLVGGNHHSDDEYLELESIPARLYLLTRMLMELGPGE